jgi:hypothetical protein
MNTTMKPLLPFCALLLFAAAASAQRHEPQDARTGSANPAVVIVRSAAKGTWAVTEFTAKAVAKPIAKTLLLKATPAVGKFVIKYAAKEAVPLMARLSVL